MALALLVSSGIAACHGSGSPGDQPSSNALAALPAALPLSTTAPAPTTSAPPVSALPYAPPARLGRLRDPNEGYSYLDRAYDEQDAFEDAPPDYAFDYNGVRPWTWATGDGGREICEPISGGGYRYYYYNPGSDTPYLVRDSGYSYAYDAGVLVGVYTLAGALVNYGSDPEYATYGGRYLHRGHDLWSYANTGQHRPVNAMAWSQQHDRIASTGADWQQQIANNAAWSAWHAAHQQNEDAYWQPVREQHQQAAQHFNQWQQQGFQGPAPQLYTDRQHDHPPDGQPGNAAPAPAPAPQAGYAAGHPGEMGAAAMTGGGMVGGAMAGGAAAMAAHAALSHHAAAGAPPTPAQGPQTREAAAPYMAAHPQTPAEARPSLLHRVMQRVTPPQANAFHPAQPPAMVAHPVAPRPELPRAMPFVRPNQPKEAQPRPPAAWHAEAAPARPAVAWHPEAAPARPPVAWHAEAPRPEAGPPHASGGEEKHHPG